MGHVMSICFVSYPGFVDKKSTQTLPKVVASGEGDTGSSVQVGWVAGWMVVRVDSDRYGEGMRL